MLLSVVNTYLRDDYTSLDELCKSLSIDEITLKDELHSAGFEYIPEVNQFR